MPGAELLTGACDGNVVVTLCGELDVAGAAEAEAAIAALVVRGQYLVIDMSVLDFIDCSALGALLRAQALARPGGGVVLAGPRPPVQRLLALTGNDEVFWVQVSVDAAVTGIASRRRRYCWRRLAVRCTPWEGSAIAYWYRMTAAAREGSLRGRARR
jgi:anti-anti-sigma factor